MRFASNRDRRMTSYRTQQGHTLLVVMVTGMLITALALNYMAREIAAAKHHRIHRTAMQAIQEASAQLEIAKNIINASKSTSKGEVTVLVDNADQPTPIASTNVYVRSIAGAEGWYELSSVVDAQGVSKTVKTLVDGTKTYAEFFAFTNTVPLGVYGDPGESFPGDLHSNAQVVVNSPGVTFEGDVTASQGIELNAAAGVNELNTTFQGVREGEAPEKALPSVADFRQIVDQNYYVERDYQAAIEIVGTQVKITKLQAAGDGTYNVISDLTLSLPSNGIIFVENDILSLKGRLDGRLSIVSEGYVNITDNLVYTDSEGNHAFIQYADDTEFLQASACVTECEASIEAAHKATVAAQADYDAALATYQASLEPVDSDPIFLEAQPVDSTNLNKWTTDAIVIEAEPVDTDVLEVQPVDTITDTQRTSLRSAVLIASEELAAAQAAETSAQETFAAAQEGLDAVLANTGETQYIENPTYKGDSVMGVMALKDIFFTGDVRSAFELNAVLYSQGGDILFEGLRYSIDPNTSTITDIYIDKEFSKESISGAGAFTADGMIATKVGDYGFQKGTLMFDPRLNLRAPPSFPGLAHPEYSAWEVVR